ncbi:Transducin/WD40 repeat-like superfamily protein [Striga hermonthica]|uniref:methylated diphthine methylhydrolase n=1 Tax=Striga hermonthica TaxID=68872 RepID=A0A9N7N2Z0_STRHE|nr:Transducin/WD40 repeat-like superfamily protein [Striga hermonthica]
MNMIQESLKLTNISTGTTGLNEVSGKHISASMCLCIDWNPPATSMAVGLSDGSVSIVSLDESGLNTLQEWKAHEFEVWAASFDTQRPTLVYTGSDDCKFSCWDLRDKPSNSVFQNTKAHEMGVCCITKSLFDPNIVLTGSYDERLRVWDVRSGMRPVNVSSICLGGGVWRIKHHPYEKGLVLAACMHNGFAVIRFEEEKEEVVEMYGKHGSLAYGVDWQWGGRGMQPVVASCSFYDRLLRVWRPERDVYA